MDQNKPDQLTITQSGGTEFHSTVDAKTVTIADTAAAATVQFDGNLNVTTGMTVAAGTGAYNVSIIGSRNTNPSNRTIP